MKTSFIIVFDATTKFPSGVLYGSAYDFGNFDECLDVRVPYQNEQFSGQYCMAKFTVESPFEGEINDSPYNYHFDDYKNFHNVSVWKKMEVTKKNSLKKYLWIICHFLGLSSRCIEESKKRTLFFLLFAIFVFRRRSADGARKILQSNKRSKWFQSRRWGF